MVVMSQGGLADSDHVGCGQAGLDRYEYRPALQLVRGERIKEGLQQRRPAHGRYRDRFVHGTPMPRFDWLKRENSARINEDVVTRPPWVHFDCGEHPTGVIDFAASARSQPECLKRTSLATIGQV